jgi:hypothetical protein
VYQRPAGAVRLSVEPQLASWDRAGHPSHVELAGFLAHVDGVAGPVLTTVNGRVATELIIGFSDDVSLIAGGRDLDNYLFPVAQRLGPKRVAAIFGLPGVHLRLQNSAKSQVKALSNRSQPLSPRCCAQGADSG